jgi:hypothetical protein
MVPAARLNLVDKKWHAYFFSAPGIVRFQRVDIRHKNIADIKKPRRNVEACLSITQFRYKYQCEYNNGTRGQTYSCRQKVARLFFGALGILRFQRVDIRHKNIADIRKFQT